jgi:DNA-binding transcriptional ArsR family regulator
VLKDAGLVTDRREGRWMYYSLNHDVLADAGVTLGEWPTVARKCC